MLSICCVFQETYSLEQACGGSSVFPTQDKTENMLMNLLMPLCLRVGSGRKGNPCGILQNSNIPFGAHV